MARPARVERATHCLEGSCSIQLSYGRSGQVFRTLPPHGQARLGRDPNWRSGARLCEPLHVACLSLCARPGETAAGHRRHRPALREFADHHLGSHMRISKFLEALRRERGIYSAASVRCQRSGGMNSALPKNLSCTPRGSNRVRRRIT